MTKIQKETTSKELCEIIVEGMQDNKAQDIVVLDLREVENAVTDFFVIGSGTSSVQLNGIADSILRMTRKIIKEKPWHVEGLNNSHWILLDYVNVVAHIFQKEVRSFYELEELWADAKKTEIENL